MFCLKCGKGLDTAGICPFCQYDNSEKSENNYLKSNEMIDLYKGDPDFELIFGNTLPKEKSEKSDLVFSSEKTHEKPVSDNFRSVPLKGSTHAAPEQRQRPSQNIQESPRIAQPVASNANDEYGQRRVIHSGDIRRENVGNDGSGRSGNANERIDAHTAAVSTKKKLNFTPIVIFLILIIFAGVIFFAVKTFGKSDDKRNDRGDDRNPVSQIETESVTGEDSTSASVDDVIQNTEPDSETPTDYVVEPTEEINDIEQGSRQDEWREKAVRLQDDLKEKIEPLKPYDTYENYWQISDKCNELSTASKMIEDYSFLWDENYRNGTEYNNDSSNIGNLEYINDIIDGKNQFSESDRKCSVFGDLNMYYFKEKGTDLNATQYLVTKGDPETNSHVGVLYIYRSNPDSQIAYMVLSYYKEPEYYVIDVSKEKVYDMDSVIAKFEQSQTEPGYYTENIYSTEPQFPIVTDYSGGEG